jgi:DNA modification methylase
LPLGEVLVGDAATRLSELPDESVDTVVTSPPYFLLRDYQTPGQIGLEESVEVYVQRLLGVLEEVRRVLKPTGALWLNLGDSFSRSAALGAPPKGMLLAPERLVLALTAAGWLLRSKVVWAKPNPMPSSVKDRLSCSWEPLYFLTKGPDYVFDLDAIRIPAASHMRGPSLPGRGTKHGGHPKRPPWAGPLAGSNAGLAAMKARGANSHPRGKNPGDVWGIATASYHGAHFATFPAALVERPLKATCPERVCSACGLPWRRSRVIQGLGATAIRGNLEKRCACPNDAAWQPGVVLDPFMGAGTVAIVAERLRRSWLGVELKAEYVTLTHRRLAEERSVRAPPSAEAA